MKVLVMVGAASSGKSTACQFLHDNGYSVLNESAETIIKQYHRDNKVLPWNGGNWIEFQNAISTEDRRKIHAVSGSFTVMDRGTEDSEVYAKQRMFHVKHWKPTYQEYGINREDVTVYMLAMLPYQNNGIRFQMDDSIRIREYNDLLDMYKSIGYNIIVEKHGLTKEERFNNILSSIHNII